LLKVVFQKKIKNRRYERMIFSFKRIWDTITNKNKLVIDESFFPSIEVNPELINLALDEGWSEEEAHKGYAIFESSFGALKVERLDCMDIFEGDFEAAVYAEKKHGLKFIKDLPDCIMKGPDLAPYIDTEENRKILSDYIKNEYNLDWE
jgi:hypothetical protein